jgi:hypothetical protein
MTPYFQLNCLKTLANNRFLAASTNILANITPPVPYCPDASPQAKDE